MRLGMPVVNVEGYYCKHDRYSHHHQDTVEIFGYSSVEATEWYIRIEGSFIRTINTTTRFLKNECRNEISV